MREERNHSLGAIKRADREGRERKFGMIAQKCFDVLLVFLGQDRAGRIDEYPTALYVTARRFENIALNVGKCRRSGRIFVAELGLFGKHTKA